MKYYTYLSYVLIALLGLYTQTVSGQQKDTLNNGRFWTVTGTGLAIYGGGMYLLGNAWYKENLSSEWQFFNDNKEWLQVDKVGHVFSSYNEAYIVSRLYRWSGLSQSKSMWLGIGAGVLGQTSIEIFDGFSRKWGFSWGDMAANGIGLAVFGLQESLWKEQRIKIKVSSDIRSYPHTIVQTINQPSNATDHLDRRAYELYGSDLPSRYLKDYNAQTNWLSINPASFSKKDNSWWPGWLNIAVGYSAENLYGGFVNSWSHENHAFVLSEDKYPRTRQFLFSFDADLTKIQVKSKFLRTVFVAINMVKFPAPALEYNSNQNFRLHWLYF